ncbi:MAG: DolP-mannose mannosyltransferase [Blastocatellia bacterium]
MTQSKPGPSWWGRVRATDPRMLAAFAFLFSTVTIAMHRPFSQLEAGDAAIYDYIAQSILRGQVPYRDVIDIKGPLAPHLSAAAMILGKSAGLRDIIAVRLFQILLAGLVSSVMVFVVAVYLESRGAALIAFLIPLMSRTFVEMMVSGTQPKLAMILFGLLALFFIAKDRPFWAGFCSMLSCLCWQPGLMFAGVALLMFSRYLTSWRDLRAVKVFVGAMIPLVVTLGYFYARGALGDMWAWTITYNFTVFGPAAEQTLSEAAAHLWIITRRVFGRDILLVGASGLGLLAFLAERLRTKRRILEALRAPDLFKDALLLPPLIYLAFSLINFQGAPDLIPFFPFMGIFAGWFFVKLGRHVAGIGSTGPTRPRFIGALVPGAAIVVMALVVLGRSASYRLEGSTLSDQDQAVQSVASLLGADDKIYVHGTVEILTLLGRSNLNPYVFLDWGADDFAAARRGTSFSALVDEMDAQAPKLVSISRLRKVYHRAELEKWVEERYDKVDHIRYDLHIRKP